MELRDATVLLVDDEPMLLDIFREWLQQKECRILTAEDGAAALQILRDERVDLVVSDVRMPVMDGILLLKNLTTCGIWFEGASRPKMIFITGFSDLEPREAYGLGIEAIIQKPIKHDEFVNEVRRRLRQREEEWAEPSTVEGLELRISLPPVPAAIEQGRIAFGQGGFCLQCTSPIREGPVRFDLEFEGEPLSFAGHGFVRWADPMECLLGVAISNLDERCREWAIGLITAHADSSYIPRAPVTVAPTFKTAR
jgi:CheY-like chemotaxis protein